MRSLWFIAHALLENQQVQKNGVVTLLVPKEAGNESSNDPKIVRFIFRDLGILPIRIQAFHHVLESQTLKFMRDITLFALGPSLRARYREHLVRVCDLAKELEPYGIDADILPADLGGTSDFNYESWLQAQRDSSFER